MTANINCQRKYYFAFLLSLTVLWAVLYAISPLQFDDFWFLPRNWAELSAKDFIFDGIDLSFYLCTHTDAGRIVNFISPIFLAMPRWVFGLFTAGCIWLVLRLSEMLSASDEGSIRSYLVVFAIIFFLPWYDFMLSTVFALNYVWSSALVLSAFYFLIKGLDGLNYKKTDRLLIAVLCFIAGWAHEGLSVPVLSGICLSFVVLRRSPDRFTCAMIVCFAMGIAMIAPSVLRRTEVAEMGYMRYSGLELLAHIVLSNAVSLIFLLILSFTFVSKKSRLRFFNSSFRDKFIIITSFGVVVTGTMINLGWYIAPRTAWGAILFGIIGSVQLIRLLNVRIGQTGRICVSALSALCVLVNLSFAIFEQAKLTAEYNVIRQLYATSGNGVIYYDNIKSKLTPSLFKTSVRCFNQRHPLSSFVIGYAPHCPITILPAILKDFDFSKSIGAPSDPNVRLYNGYAVVSGGYEPSSKTAIVAGGNGIRIESSYRLLPFSDSSGKKWQLLLPNVPFFAEGNISDVNLRF